MAIVTISRHFGAGGQTLGEKLCERFNFHLVDASVIEELARKAKLSPNWLTAMEKEASSTSLSILSSIASRGLFYKTPGGSPVEHEDRTRYRDFLKKLFTDMAGEGGYVIVGRGAQVLLKGHPRAIHFLLVSDMESRIAFLVEHYNLSRPEAENLIRQRERERASVASRLLDADIDDPTLYHLAFNTSRIPYEWAVDMVFKVVSGFLEKE